MSIPKRFHAPIAALIMGIAGIGFGYFIGKLLKQNRGDLHLGLEIIPVLIVDLWLVLAWHELGHLIGGWMAGFQFQFYAVGPLRLDRDGQQIRISFNRTPSLWGGMAASTPDPQNIPEGESLRNKMLLVVSGGPLASVLGGLMAIPAFALWQTHPTAAAAGFIFAVASTLIALVTMFPIGNGGFVNDGGRILNLLRRDQAAYLWMSMATLGSLSRRTRPRLWPAHLIEDATRNPEPSFDGIMAMWMRYSWHLDRKELPEAKHWLEQALGHVNAWPPAARPILHSSAADFYSRLEPNVPRARHHLSEAQKPGFMPAEALALSEASVLLAEGNKPAAREKILTSRKLLDTTTGTSRDSIRELIEELETQA